jgi:DNA-binding transcriptional LysR family regulator
VRVDGSLHANSGDAVLAAAFHGLGIAYEPDFLVGAAVQRGQLIGLLPGYAGGSGDIWAVYPSRRHLSLKVRLFVDHIAREFAAAAPPL